MRAFMKRLLAPMIAIFEGTWTSGAESCDYLARLEAVPAIGRHVERRAA
jgi:hypothetical protein